MLAHADLHLIVPELEDGLAGCRMCCRAHGHRQRSHIVGHALGQFDALFERGSTLSGRTCDLVHGHASH